MARYEDDLIDIPHGEYNRQYIRNGWTRHEVFEEILKNHP